MLLIACPEFWIQLVRLKGQPERVACRFAGLPVLLEKLHLVASKLLGSSWNFLLKCNHCKRKIDPNPNTHILVLYLPCSSVALWSLWFLSEGLILIWTNCQDSIISLHNCELIRFDRLIFVLWDLHAVLERSRKAHSHIRSWTLAARQGQIEFSPFQTSRDSVSLTSRLACLSFLTCPCLPRTRSRLRSTYTLSCLVGRIRTDVDRPKRGIDGWLSPLFASRLMCEDNQLAILNQLQRTSSPEAQAFYWSSDETERSNIQKHPSQLPDTHKSLWGYNLCRGSKIFVSASLKFSGFFGASISLFLLCFLAWK